MKNEDAFNARLSALFNKRAPDLLSYKTCDKYHSGIPDFFLTLRGLTAAVECKFLQEWPEPGKKKLLSKHEFTGPQVTYLERVWRAGGRAYGLIGVEEARSMYLVPFTHIPSSGNWDPAKFRERWARLGIAWMDVDTLIKHIFA